MLPTLATSAADRRRQLPPFEGFTQPVVDCEGYRLPGRAAQPTRWGEKCILALVRDDAPLLVGGLVHGDTSAVVTGGRRGAPLSLGGSAFFTDAQRARLRGQLTGGARALAAAGDR